MKENFYPLGYFFSLQRNHLGLSNHQTQPQHVAEPLGMHPLLLRVLVMSVFAKLCGWLDIANNARKAQFLSF